MQNLMVSKEGTKVLEELHSLMIEEGRNENYLKLNRNGENSGIMPVVVEVMRLFDANPKRKVISVAHYFESHGDLCADPYMEFLRDESGPEVFYVPIRYKTEGSVFARDRDSVILNDNTGSPEKYSKRASHEDKVFATQWMRNIAYQQKLKTKVRVTG